MLKRLFALGSVVLLLHAAHATPVAAFVQTNQGETQVEKVKAEVAKRAGKKSRVTVKLRDGSKLKGHITQAGADSFTLTDSKTGQSRTLAYGDVLQVKKPGLSLGAKIALGVGIVAVALVVVVAIGLATADFRPGRIL